MRKAWHNKKKRGKIGRNILSILLAVVLFSGGICSLTVSANLINEGFNNKKTGISTLEKLCEEITIWRKVIKGLPKERPEYAKQYTFWLGNLDDESSRELIVRLYRNTDNIYQESLLVYDLKEKNHTVSPVFLFETSPYVQIRSGFSGNPKGTGVMFNAVVSLYQGECVEGTVQLNQDKSDLKYTVTRTYSMAKQEHASKDLVDISGSYDAENPSNCDWGILNQEELVNHNFVLGRDNNSFKHNINPKDKRSGFANLSSYDVSPEQKKILLRGESKSTKAEIKDYLNGTFRGVCLGLTSMMELVKSGDIQLSDYGEKAQVFYKASKPNKNNALFQEICFLHTTQFVLENEDYDGFVDFNRKNTVEQLEKLIKAVNSEHWQILSFITKYSGHALLVKGLTYYKSLGLYRLECYDVNSLEENPEGLFYPMFIRDDFSDFVLIDANGDRVTQDNCQELYLISADTILHEKQAQTKAIKEENSKTAVLSFLPPQGSMSCTDAQGNQLVCQGGQITERADHMISLPSVINQDSQEDGKFYRRVMLSDSERYTIQCDPARVDVRIRTGEEYYSLQGHGINTIVFSKENGIQIIGEDFTFTAGLLMNSDSDHLLTQTSGSGSGTVTLRDVKGTLQVSCETPVHIKNLSSIYDTKTVQQSVNKKTTHLTLAPDGMLKVESSGCSVWVFISIGAVLVILLVVVLLVMNKRRKAAPPRQ